MPRSPCPTSQTPAVTPLELGKAPSAVLSATEPEAWFSTELEAKDYKVTAEFTRTDQAKSLSAYLSMLGRLGEQVKGPSSICSVTDNLKTATCTSKLVVAQDGPVTLRLTAHWKARATTRSPSSWNRSRTRSSSTREAETSRLTPARTIQTAAVSCGYRIRNELHGNRIGGLRHRGSRSAGCAGQLMRQIYPDT